MKHLFSFNRPAATPPPAAQAALRDLYRNARCIPYHAPYAAARLARIADQSEYFLQEWPAEQWPLQLPAGSPMPTKDVLLAWIAAAKTEASYYLPPASHPWTYAAWHQITTTLLAALAPFA